MPNTKSAERRMRSNARRQLHNKSGKSRLKSLEKTFLASVLSGRKEDAATGLRAVSSALDKAAKTGIIPRSMANRKKSRLAARMNSLR